MRAAVAAELASMQKQLEMKNQALEASKDQSKTLKAKASKSNRRVKDLEKQLAKRTTELAAARKAQVGVSDNQEVARGTNKAEQTAQGGAAERGATSPKRYSFVPSQPLGLQHQFSNEVDDESWKVKYKAEVVEREALQHKAATLDQQLRQSEEQIRKLTAQLTRATESGNAELVAAIAHGKWTLRSTITYLAGGTRKAVSHRE